MFSPLHLLILYTLLTHIALQNLQPGAPFCGSIHILIDISCSFAGFSFSLLLLLLLLFLLPRRRSTRQNRPGPCLRRTTIRFLPSLFLLLFISDLPLLCPIYLFWPTFQQFFLLLGGLRRLCCRCWGCAAGKGGSSGLKHPCIHIASALSRPRTTSTGRRRASISNLQGDTHPDPGSRRRKGGSRRREDETAQGRVPLRPLSSFLYTYTKSSPGPERLQQIEAPTALRQPSSFVYCFP